MFSKINSFFKREKSNTDTSTKFDHSKLETEDASQCPFMKKNMKNPEEKQDKKKYSNKKKNERASSDEESQEEEAPRGGCPFMKPSGKKKNPDLGITHEGYDQPYISRYRYYLSGSKLNLNMLKKGTKGGKVSRDVFDTYPLYLQHTLFYNEEDFKKVRSLECCSRFLAYEQLRQKGNKFYNKGKYAKSLIYYERAMSLFRYLEYRDPDQPIPSQSEIEFSQVSSEEETEKSKIVLNLASEGETKTQNPFTSQLDELQTKYKEFFITYGDQNVVYHDGMNFSEEADLSMARSLLLQIYLNMAGSYIYLNHFSMAKKLCEQAFAISKEISQVHLRMSQAIAFDKGSTLLELHRAKEYMEFAIKNRPQEKIFKNSNQNILKLINIHDAQKVYQCLAEKIAARIEQKTAERNNLVEKMEDRLAQINENEKQIIAQGKVPRESHGFQPVSFTDEQKIILKMREKYIRVIQFYTESNNKEQVSLAKNELQEVLRVLGQAKTIINLQVNLDQAKFGGDMGKKKRRLDNIKRQYCEEYFNNGKYNFSVLEWAVKEIVEEDKKRKEEEQKKRKEEDPTIQDQAPAKKWDLMSKLPYAMVLVPVLVFVINYSTL